MAMRLWTSEQLASELQRRGCRKVGDDIVGYEIWEDQNGEPFSVPPPKEVTDGRLCYPDWMLDDLIREVGLPPEGPQTH